MLTTLLSMIALSLSPAAGAQNENTTNENATALSQSTDYLAKPPVTIRKGPSCQCPDEIENETLTLIGIVVNVEMTMAPDGISVNDRQATIFNINPSSTSNYQGRTKIWHSSNKAQCGMTFNYGAIYKLRVRKTKDGALETDSCLMLRPVKN